MSWTRFVLPLLLLLPTLGAVYLLAYLEQLTPAQTLAASEGIYRVGVIDSPSIYQLDDNDRAHGFEYDLIKRFARHQNKALRVMSYPSPQAVIQALKHKELDFAPIGYQLPPSPLDGSDVLSTQAKYHKNDWLLVHRAEANAVKSWAELANKKVLVMPRIELHPAYQQLLQTHRKVLFHTTSESDEEAVIAALSLGEFDYALVDENLFQLTQHIFYDIGKSFTVLTQQRAWLTSNRQAGLRFAIDRFFDQHLSKTELAALVEKHFAHTQKIKMFDLAVFETRITERLPKWKPFFQQAQQQHQIDWRLFAALAYQESQWDEKAVSGTNVQGIMQLTEDTARRYQVDRNNPTEAIAAGARYYADLYQKTPARIPEPDRSWFALAAYNLGLGHIEDARLLCAQARRNPDSWAEGKKMLPQLAVPHVAAKTKHGLARGGMAVEFVDNIRAYYELLQRLEPH